MTNYNPQVPVHIRGISKANSAYVQKSTSSDKLTSQVAGNFMQIYASQVATGDTRAAYIRLYADIAAASGEAVRAFGTVNDVAAATFRGAHISLNFGTTGTITGLGAALEATLHIPSGGKPGGTITAVKAAINSDGTIDPDTSALSVFNVVNQGDATGMDHVDDVAALFDIDGFDAASGNMIGANIAGGGTFDLTNVKPIRITIDGVAHYLIAATAVAAT